MAVRPRRRSRLWAATAVVVAIGIVAAAFVVTDGFHLGRSKPVDDLIPAHSDFSLPGSQYDDIAFVLSTTSHISGTFYDTLGIIVYILSPLEIKQLNHNGTVSSYNWSSGRIANLTVYDLNITVYPGEWNLVFLNPNILNTTVVAFYSTVTLVSE